MMDYKISREEWLENIIDTIPLGLVVINKKGVVCNVSDAYCDLIDLPRSEIIGKRLIDIRPEAKLPMTLIDGKSRRVIVSPKSGDIVTEFSPLMYKDEIVGALSCGESLTNWNKKNAELIEQIKTLKKENQKIVEYKSAKYTFSSIVSVAPSMEELFMKAKRAAVTKLPVLITGESGTGKELLAQSIHNSSYNSEEPFLAVNCAAIPPALLESEIFGYEAGSFTGANKSGKSGLFEIAGDGTIFLDEIGEMSIELQSKLLRVLQEKKYRRVGGNKEYTVNARFITATNQNLEHLIDRRRFREDLYYRINTVILDIPPLRKRIMDIPILVNHFLKISDERVPNKSAFEINQQTMEILKEYSWPGNVRELKNAVEYAVCMATDNVIDIRCLPASIQDYYLAIKDRNIVEGKTLKEYTDAYEAKIVYMALNKYGWDLLGKRKTAKALNISLGTLYNKIKWLGIKQDNI